MSLSWQAGLSGQATPVYDEPIEVEIIIERPAEASPEPAAMTETIREGVTTDIAEPPSESSPDPQPTLQAEAPEPAQAPVPPKPKEPVKSAKAQQPSKQARSGDNASLIDAYRLQVAAQIARNKPANSFAATAQGVALVSFIIAQNGQAGSIKLTQSSGHSTLDQEAIATIKRSSPFPAPPDLATRTFTVPIRFQTRS
jgi:protein TonB